MFEVIFLGVLALLWVAIAVFQDMKCREIPDWLNFSLIVFALGFRFFYSLFSEIGFSLFYQGLIGLGIFFVLGNLLYYGRMFAGGDAKLMVALGAVLPFYVNFLDNVSVFVWFFLLFFFSGALYSLGGGVVTAIKNSKTFRKEFGFYFKKSKKIIYLSLFLAFAMLALCFFEFLFLFLAVFIFILPYLYVFAKAADESMVREVSVRKLTEGDWLYSNMKVGKKIIKAKWEGLSKEEIQLLRKNYKKVKLKQGIPFTPVFLISLVVLLGMIFLGVVLRNPLW